jgi:hypothetical protein
MMAAVLVSYFFAYCTMGALGTLELVFCSQVLMVDTEMYGVVISIAGLGAIGGSVLLGMWRTPRTIDVYVWGLCLFGVGIVFFGLQTTLYAVIPFLIVEGVGESFFTIGGRSYLQHKTPTEYMGKTMAYMEMMQKTGLLAGMVLAGVFATYASVVIVLSISGVMTLLAGMMVLIMKWSVVGRSVRANIV